MSSELSKLLIESRQRSAAYETLIEDSNIRKLGPANMQAVLLQVEDFLDSNHLYAYKNWFEGEVYDGPDLEKYWVRIKLKYDYNLMPDPQAVERLVNLGVTVKYEEVKEQTDEKEEHFWVISLRIPKTLINID